MAELQVRMDDLQKTRLVETAAADLGQGEVLVEIERFAFTANNITYGAVGELIGYWKFFPARGADAAGWGVLPVWGFATVAASRTAEIPEGDRLYGYFPPADHLTMAPVKVAPTRFFDGADHRAALPQGYNIYQRVFADPGYDRASDDRRALLAPLHMTSFCLWDALKDADWRGAAQIVIVSASAKTSIGLAYALSQDPEAPPAIGLTSPRNMTFVEGLGFYDQQVAYDAMSALDVGNPTVIVDMAGNGEVLGALHAALGQNMRHTINVGVTHWEDRAPHPAIDQQKSEFFFAPGHIQKRMKEWGTDAFNEKANAFVAASAEESRRWMTVREIHGLAALESIYGDICNGRLAASEGVIVTL